MGVPIRRLRTIRVAEARTGIAVIPRRAATTTLRHAPIPHHVRIRPLVPTRLHAVLAVAAVGTTVGILEAVAVTVVEVVEDRTAVAEATLAVAVTTEHFTN